MNKELKVFPIVVKFTQPIRNEDSIGELTHYTYRTSSAIVNVVAPDYETAKWALVREWKSVYPDVEIVGSSEPLKINIMVVDDPVRHFSWYQDSTLRAEGPERKER